MEIKVEVSDELFKEVAENSLRVLTPEQLTDICKQAIAEYFRKDGYRAVEELLVDKGDYNWDYRATNFTKKILESCDLSKLQDVIDQAIEKLKTNYDTLLKSMLTDLMVRGLADNYTFSQGIKDALRQING